MLVLDRTNDIWIPEWQQRCRKDEEEEKDEEI
jgi:hypothetical protein